MCGTAVCPIGTDGLLTQGSKFKVGDMLTPTEEFLYNASSNGVPRRAFVVVGEVISVDGKLIGLDSVDGWYHQENLRKVWNHKELMSLQQEMYPRDYKRFISFGIAWTHFNVLESTIYDIFEKWSGYEEDAGSREKLLGEVDWPSVERFEDRILNLDRLIQTLGEPSAEIPEGYIFTSKYRLIKTY